VSPLIRTATYNILKKKKKKIILHANLRIIAHKGFAILNSIPTPVGRSQMKTMCNVDDLSCDRLGLFEPSDVKIRGNLFTLSCKLEKSPYQDIRA
jgi:hypothetical protein